MNTIDLSGQRVLVTGASRGIGLALARAFASSGADLHILADDAAIDGVGEILSKEASRVVRAWRCDITDGARVDRVAEEIGAVDVLINNAGLEQLTPIEDQSPVVESSFRRIIDINVVGTFLLTRAVLRHMPDGGRIVNTASIWGRTAEAGFSAYVASKHAVIGLTRTLAKELAPRAIRVNAVCPGWVRTDAALHSAELMARRGGVPREVILATVEAAQALPGFLAPEDIAGLYLFLASPLSANITGQSIVIDRGGVLA